MRKCARAIILDEDNNLLVFERTRTSGLFRRKTHHYYSIPGGGIESHETPEQAVVRELREEMLIDIDPLQPLIHQIDEPDSREHYYFLARITAGVPTFNLQSEEGQADQQMGRNTYKIAWVPLDEPLLSYHKSYAQVARQVNEWLKSGSFPPAMVDMTVKNR